MGVAGPGRGEPKSGMFQASCCGEKSQGAEVSLCSPPVLLTSPHRYEEEINRRANTENDFVVLKKVKGGGGPRGAVGPRG